MRRAIHTSPAAFILLLLSAVLFTTILLAVSFGSTPIPISTIAQILLNGTGLFHFARQWDSSAELIVWQVRMPVVVGAAFVGAALSVAGVLFQGILRNPLADPFPIGDSDHTLALRLANEVITEQPYAPISPEALQRVHTSLTRVSLLIICPVPIGPGNVALQKTECESPVAFMPGMKHCSFLGMERSGTCVLHAYMVDSLGEEFPPVKQMPSWQTRSTLSTSAGRMRREISDPSRAQQ